LNVDVWKCARINALIAEKWISPSEAVFDIEEARGRLLDTRKRALSTLQWKTYFG
jgi:hypothetical protein